MSIDVTKPLYLDGERVYLVGNGTRHTGESNEDFWARMWLKPDGYINVSKLKYNGPNSQGAGSTFYRENGRVCTISQLKGTLSNSPKDNDMVDFTKALTVGNKDAKIIHTFDNGNIAVVVDGRQSIYTYDNRGRYLSGDQYGLGAVTLKNKVEVTTRYLNVYPDNYSVYKYGSVSQANAGLGQSRERGYGFMVKQTLHDGKVVSTEIVDG